MDVRLDALEPAQQLRVIVPRQVRVQAVDHVDFGERLVGALAQLVPRLLERHRVRALVAGLQSREGAEEAACDADVGRLETDVVVVERLRAVAFFALAIGEPSHRQQIAALEEPDPVSEAESLATIELPRDVQETGVREAAVHWVIEQSGNWVIGDYRITQLSNHSMPVRKCRRSARAGIARAGRRARPSGCAAIGPRPLPRR